jgi:hypothetical protein
MSGHGLAVREGVPSSKVKTKREIGGKDPVGRKGRNNPCRKKV